MNWNIPIKKVLNFCLYPILLFPTINESMSQNITPLKQQDEGWEIVKVDKHKESSWIIYKREFENTNFLAYKIENNIPSSTIACISAFKQDLYNEANNNGNKKYPTYEILDETDSRLTTYVIHKEPFPLRDTEMCVRYKFSESEGDQRVKWDEAWDEYAIQPNKKLKRIQTFRGSLAFYPVTENACKAVKSVQFDPKKMPLWLVEPMVFKFLKESLENITSMTASAY